jgi:glycosyltransferase involved in cell wall biosynthesis
VADMAARAPTHTLGIAQELRPGGVHKTPGAAASLRYISQYNERIKLPQTGIQYLHFPRTYPARPRVDYWWFHWLPGVLKLYGTCCYWIAGTTWADLRRNLTLANSDYIASIFEAYHNVKPRTVFPAAPGHFTVRPWAEKKDQIVCLGRIAPEKDLPKVEEITRQLRALGHNLPLLVIGTWNCSGAYRCNLHRLLEQYRDWVQLEQDIPRQDVVRLLEESRYGMHGMVGEYFGMAVAEMQRAGSVVFVPHIGGPVETVGHEPRVIYASVEEAVTKINAVLCDPGCRRNSTSVRCGSGSCLPQNALCARFRRSSASLCRPHRQHPTYLPLDYRGNS